MARQSRATKNAEAPIAATQSLFHLKGAKRRSMHFCLKQKHIPHAYHAPTAKSDTLPFSKMRIQAGCPTLDGKIAKSRENAAFSRDLVPRRGFEPRTPCLKGRCSAD